MGRIERKCEAYVECKAGGEAEERMTTMHVRREFYIVLISFMFLIEQARH